MQGGGRGRGRPGNPLDTNANQYGQTISQKGSSSSRRGWWVVLALWGSVCGLYSLKCINKLKRDRACKSEREGEGDRHCFAWFVDVTLRSFQSGANCNLISNPASGATSSMAIICCKYSLTRTHTHTSTRCVYIGIITHTSRWPGQHFNFWYRSDSRGRGSR